MNKTKFLLLAALGGLIVLSCGLFEPADTDDDVIGYVPLEKLPYSEAAFKYSVAEKVGDLYVGTDDTGEYLGKVSFDGEGGILTFEITEDHHTALVKNGTYQKWEDETLIISYSNAITTNTGTGHAQPYTSNYYINTYYTITNERSLQYVSEKRLNPYYKENDTIIVQMTNLTDGNIKIVYTFDVTNINRLIAVTKDSSTTTNMYTNNGTIDAYGRQQYKATNNYFFKWTK